MSSSWAASSSLSWKLCLAFFFLIDCNALKTCIRTWARIAIDIIINCHDQRPCRFVKKKMSRANRVIARLGKLLEQVGILDDKLRTQATEWYIVRKRATEKHSVVCTYIRKCRYLSNGTKHFRTHERGWYVIEIGEWNNENCWFALGQLVSLSFEFVLGLRVPTRSTRFVIHSVPHEHTHTHTRFLLRKSMNRYPPVNSDLRNKLIDAANDGNLAVLREYVSELPSVRGHFWNQSVLHLSAGKGHFECVDFISLAHPHMISMRMQDDGRSRRTPDPLHRACVNSHLSVVSLLIERDSHTMTMTHNDGGTPLHCACSNGHLSIVSLLLDKCLDPALLMSVRNNDGKAPLQYASFFGKIEVARFLLSMIPSPANQQEALSAADIRTRESFAAAISLIPVVEWQRQLGLQDEYLCVERTLILLAQQKDEQELQEQHQESPILINTTNESLCVLVLRAEVLRRTRFLFQLSQQNGRAIPQQSLEYHQRKWHLKFTLEWVRVRRLLLSLHSFPHPLACVLLSFSLSFTEFHVDCMSINRHRISPFLFYSYCLSSLFRVQRQQDWRLSHFFLHT